MFKPSLTDAAILICLFSAGPALVTCMAAFEQPAVKHPAPRTIIECDGIVQLDHPGFAPFANWDCPVDLVVHLPNTFRTCRLTFACKQDYLEAVRCDGLAVRVSGFEVTRGYQTYFVVETITGIETEAANDGR